MDSRAQKIEETASESDCNIAEIINKRKSRSELLGIKSQYNTIKMMTINHVLENNTPFYLQPSTRHFKEESKSN